MQNNLILFIKVGNGQPVDHPIILENFQQVYPEIDINNLPQEFARFERVPCPPLGVYEKNQTVNYEKGDDGVYRDVWSHEQMTPEEIKAKQDQVKAEWASNPNTYKSWIFDENICGFVPPVLLPNDGNRYIWEEALKEWKLEL
jgi:hypothetical protein